MCISVRVGLFAQCFAILILSALGLFSAVHAANAATLEEVRSHHENGRTRLVLAFIGKTAEMPDCSYFTLKQRDRLVLDCKGVKISKTVLVSEETLGPYIKRLRFGDRGAPIARVVMDLKAPAQAVNLFFLSESKASGRTTTRLVIDMEQASRQAFNAATDRRTQIKRVSGYRMAKPTHDEKGSDAPVSETALEAMTRFILGGDNQESADEESTHLESPASTKPEPKQTASQKQPSARKPKKSTYVILIDPGHGGRDPGAVGPNKIYEKHITLAMALALRKELESRGQFKVYLTREDDSSISLKRRRDAARTHEADIFMSLHADALPEGQNRVRGASIHILSEKGGSDALSDALATRENEADIEIGLNLSDETEEVASILASLTSRETQNLSRLLAEQIVQDLRKDVRVMKKPVRRAAFKVLKSLDIPSVLIEMGFMTNPSDLKNFRSSAFRKLFVKRLADALEAYFVNPVVATGY